MLKTEEAIATDSDPLLDHYCRMAREIYWSFFDSFSEKATGRRTRGAARNNPRWDGGEDDYGREHRPVWPKIVRTAVEAEIDVYDLIAAQFNVASLVSPPQPGQCHGPQAVANVNRSGEMSKHMLLGELSSYRDRLIVSVGLRLRGSAEAGPTVDRVNEIHREVVVDPTVEIDPVFRYCEANRLGVGHRLSPAMKASALLAYMSRRKAYDAVWGSFIPEKLSNGAAKVRADMTQRTGGRRARG